MDNRLNNSNVERSLSFREGEKHEEAELEKEEKKELLTELNDYLRAKRNKDRNG